MTKQRKIGAAAELRRREAATRRVQDAGPGSSSELERLTAHVAEFMRELRQRDLVITGLRRRLDELDDEEGVS